jgi:hypothetical protein
MKVYNKENFILTINTNTVSIELKMNSYNIDSSGILFEQKTNL